jgi:hypothetical protein
MSTTHDEILAARSRDEAEHAQRRAERNAAAEAATAERERRQAAATPHEVARSEAGEAAERAVRAATLARSTVARAATEIKRATERDSLHPEDVHAGVDLMCEAARSALAERLAEHRRRLAKGVTVGVPMGGADLSRLVTLYVAATPGFAAALHELLDSPEQMGVERYAAYSKADLAAIVARARTAEQALKTAAGSAERHAAIASEERKRVDLGSQNDLGPIRRAAAAAEAARGETAKALADVIAVLAGEKTTTKEQA